MAGKGESRRRRRNSGGGGTIPVGGGAILAGGGASPGGGNSMRRARSGSPVSLDESEEYRRSIRFIFLFFNSEKGDTRAIRVSEEYWRIGVSHKFYTAIQRFLKYRCFVVKAR